ncbi:MAG TPA: UDP-4-amino-4,6-dideoxy-N-acetyl-beta-L-altrosamine transaminase [Acidobacteriota bacterium]|nr:UDP-4-amino-4,6-dideoxy-N-acetyl-beta-L-altrosamine transaminase [Acidobacteriota bacterium]
MPAIKVSKLKGRVRPLAVDGGQPVRGELLPYGRQTIEEEDLQAVCEALRSPLITTGPRVDSFEKAFARRVGVRQCVAVNSGTAALHCAAHVLGIGPGDEVIVPTLTFAATANVVLYQGARPVFADVDPDQLLIDPTSVESLITPRTRAIFAVDYAGQPCDYPALRQLAERHGLALLADACHAPGARLQGRPVGSLADVTCFSLHPVKHMTTGEGGLITTDREDWAARMRRFRNHGISVDHRDRLKNGSWHYEIRQLGYNYRLTDVQSALGLSQLRRLRQWVKSRRRIAARYDRELRQFDALRPLKVREDVEHAYHLYVVRLDLSRLRVGRGQVFKALRAEGIGVNVHYIPVHLHPLYRRQLGTGPGLCPQAEKAYSEIVTLPVFPSMTPGEQDDVLEALNKVLQAYRR